MRDNDHLLGALDSSWRKTRSLVELLTIGTEQAFAGCSEMSPCEKVTRQSVGALLPYVAEHVARNIKARKIEISVHGPIRPYEYRYPVTESVPTPRDKWEAVCRPRELCLHVPGMAAQSGWIRVEAPGDGSIFTTADRAFVGAVASWIGILIDREYAVHQRSCFAERLEEHYRIETLFRQLSFSETSSPVNDDCREFLDAIRTCVQCRCAVVSFSRVRSRGARLEIFAGEEAHGIRRALRRAARQRLEMNALHDGVSSSSSVSVVRVPVGSEVISALFVIVSDSESRQTLLALARGKGEPAFTTIEKHALCTAVALISRSL